jgi:hypothetical protein
VITPLGWTTFHPNKDPMPSPTIKLLNNDTIRLTIQYRKYRRNQSTRIRLTHMMASTRAGANSFCFSIPGSRSPCSRASLAALVAAISASMAIRLTQPERVLENPRKNLATRAPKKVRDMPNQMEQMADNKSDKSSVFLTPPALRRLFQGIKLRHRPVVNAVPSSPAYQPTESTVTLSDKLP